MNLSDSRKLGASSDIVLVRGVGLFDFSGAWFMSKREIIDYILEINKSAKPEFLAQFPVEELDLYLEHLMELDLEDVALCA